jgi:hypothetical protein
MTVTQLVIVYIICALFYLNAFMDQRAALEIGRAMGQDIRPLVLPNGLGWVWIPRIIRWICFGLLVLGGQWIGALVLIGAEYLVTAVIPIPRSKYEKITRRLDEMKKYGY